MSGNRSQEKLYCWTEGGWLDDADYEEVCAAPSGGGSRAEDTLTELPDSSRLNPSSSSLCFLPAFVLSWRWSLVDITNSFILFHRQIPWNSTRVKDNKTLYMLLGRNGKLSRALNSPALVSRSESSTHSMLVNKKIPSHPPCVTFEDIKFVLTLTKHRILKKLLCKYEIYNIFQQVFNLLRIMFVDHHKNRVFIAFLK